MIMSVKLSEFDPSRAQLGVHANLRGDGLAYSSQYISSGNSLAPSNRSNIEYKETVKLGSEKQAAYEGPDWADYETGTGNPNLKNSDEAAQPRNTDTDLHVHGIHEYTTPKPNPAEMIKARLAKYKTQEKSYEQKAIDKMQEEQESNHEKNMSIPTDVSIDRRGLEPRSTFMKRAEDEGPLADSELNPIKLMLILDEKWGDEWLKWEPETIVQTANVDGLSIHRVNMDKIFAIKVIKNTEEFFKDARVFEKVCVAFGNRLVDWGTIQSVHVHDMAGAVALIERYIKEGEWDSEIESYVAASSIADGFLMLPPQLSFAQNTFNHQLALNMGDDVVDVYTQLVSTLDGESSVEDADTKVAVQYMRLMRCQYHVQAMIDEARS